MAEKDKAQNTPTSTDTDVDELFAADTDTKSSTTQSSTSTLSETDEKKSTTGTSTTSSADEIGEFGEIKSGSGDDDLGDAEASFRCYSDAESSTLRKARRPSSAKEEAASLEDAFKQLLGGNVDSTVRKGDDTTDDGNLDLDDETNLSESPEAKAGDVAAVDKDGEDSTEKTSDLDAISPQLEYLELLQKLIDSPFERDDDGPVDDGDKKIGKIDEPHRPTAVPLAPTSTEVASDLVAAPPDSALADDDDGDDDAKKEGKIDKPKEKASAPAPVDPSGTSSGDQPPKPPTAPDEVPPPPVVLPAVAVKGPAGPPSDVVPASAGTKTEIGPKPKGQLPDVGSKPVVTPQPEVARKPAVEPQPEVAQQPAVGPQPEVIVQPPAVKESPGTQTDATVSLKSEKVETAVKESEGSITNRAKVAAISEDLDRILSNTPADDGSPVDEKNLRAKVQAGQFANLSVPELRAALKLEAQEPEFGQRTGFKCTEEAFRRSNQYLNGMVVNSHALLATARINRSGGDPITLSTVGTDPLKPNEGFAHRPETFSQLFVDG